MKIVESLNFKVKTYKEIFLTHLEDSFEMGLLSSDKNFLDYVKNREDIENNYIMQSSVHSNTLATAYKDMNLIYNALNIDNASNQDLDYIGELVGINRRLAQSSLTELIFSLDSASNSDITIPKGTIVSNKSYGGTQYYTLETKTLYKGETSVNVSAYSVGKGETSIHVSKGEINYIQSNIERKDNKKINVTNTITSSGGRVREEDNEYRVRIKKWPYILKRGTLDCYKNYLDNLEGLNAYNIINMWDGPGTMKILINPGPDYLIDKITKDIITDVMVADDDVIIEKAVEKSIDVDLIVNISIDSNNTLTTIDKEILEKRIKELISTYIDGGTIKAYKQVANTNITNSDTFKLTNINYSGLSIGDNFIPQKCSTFIDEQLNFTGENPIKNITFNLPSSFVSTLSNDYYGNILDDETATCGVINVKII